MKKHTCDRKGPPAKVIDESCDKPITRIYPTRSVCGVPQVFAKTRAVNALPEGDPASAGFLSITVRCNRLPGLGWSEDLLIQVSSIVALLRTR